MFRKLRPESTCWCGSGKEYKNCHREFDKKVNLARSQGHMIPSHRIIKTPEQIEGIRESGKLNIAICEINFTDVLNLNEKKYVVESVSKYPGSEQDFNFIVPKNVSYAEVEKIAKSIELDLQYKVSLLDIYEPTNSEFKNMTLHYEIFRNDRTLKGEEVEDFHNKVIEQFKSNNIELKLN